MTGRYVALGSSMAAGPGIAPRAAGSPPAARRYERNNAPLVAAERGLDLVDVTFSGATTAHVLDERQRGAPPQADALDGTEELVTVTIGGNDAGYVGALMAAGLPLPLRALTRLLPGGRDRNDRAARDRDLDELPARLVAIGEAVRRRAPRARALFVDYLTLLPPAGIAAPPLSASAVELGRHVGGRLAEITADAARATGCEIVRASEASRDHHPWSAQPWTTGAGAPLPGRPVPFHPNVVGMRAVADLVLARLMEDRSRG